MFKYVLACYYTILVDVTVQYHPNKIGEIWTIPLYASSLPHYCCLFDEFPLCRYLIIRCGCWWSALLAGCHAKHFSTPRFGEHCMPSWLFNSIWCNIYFFKVKLFVSKLTSTKTQMPYDYYSLPYCKPKRTGLQSENLGEVISGDRIENSVYKVLSSC